MLTSFSVQSWISQLITEPMPGFTDLPALINPKVEMMRPTLLPWGYQRIGFPRLNGIFAFPVVAERRQNRGQIHEHVQP